MVEFTYMIYGIAAGVLSFLLVKPNINFAYYFFVMTRTASKDGSNAYLESKSEGHRFNFRQLIKILYANLLAPIFVALLFMNELTGSWVTGMIGFSDLSWQIIRLMLVLSAIALRFLIFREEL